MCELERKHQEREINKTNKGIETRVTRWSFGFFVGQSRKK